MPWRTECNRSIWQWPECSFVPESRNQSRYTFVLRVGAHQRWVSWKLQLVGEIQRFIENTTFRWVLKVTPFMTLIIKIRMEIWFVFFSHDQHLFLNLLVTLNQSDVSKYEQKVHLLTDMCKEEQMQWITI